MSFSKARVLALFALGFSACATGTGGTPPPPPPEKVATPEDPAEKTPEQAAPKEPALPPNQTRIKVVGLSDFHGWLLPLEPSNFPKYYGGIANIAGMLKHKEQLTDKNALVLDNGDMWTGPFESTLLRGESVIQAYNALGVTAANVANHEFDFGQEILRARIAEAKFPFLGANIVKTGTTEHPEFLKPWIIVEREGVKVGVVGLGYIKTPQTTMAKHVIGLEFLSYADTLKKAVPEVRAAGAEVIVVLFHDEISIAKKVMEGLPEIKVEAVIGGQNHRKERVEVRGIPIVNPGPFGRSYVRFDIIFDTKTRKTVSVDSTIVDVTGDVGAPPFPPSTELTAIAEKARQKAESLTGEVLGRLGKPLPIGNHTDSPLGHFVVDSWLRSVPDAEIAILNHGALRQPMASGPVTIGGLLSALPFENNLYVVRLTPKQIKEQLMIDSPIVGGMTWSFKEKNKKRKVVSMVDMLGRPLKAGKKYRVVILDFMYTGGDGYRFKEFDSAPEDTGLSWREPPMKALRRAFATNRAIEPKVGARARALR